MILCAIDSVILLLADAMIVSGPKVSKTGSVKDLNKKKIVHWGLWSSPQRSGRLFRHFSDTVARYQTLPFRPAFMDAMV